MKDLWPNPGAGWIAERAKDGKERRMADDIEALKLKITELENKLNELTTGPEPTDITAEEVAAYQKVAAQIPPVMRPCVISSCRGCGRGCGRGGCAQPCIVAAAADEEELMGAAACGRGGCVVARPCVLQPCQRGCGRGGCSQPCIAAAAYDDEEIQGAMACRGCGRGCSYCYYAKAVPCAGAAKGDSRPRHGVGRFARLGA